MVFRSRHFQGNDRLVQAASNTPFMKKGEVGFAVRLLQQALMDLGYPLPKSTNTFKAPDGTKLADGIYGPEVKGQVRQFQIDEGLGKDGIAGAETLGQMDLLLVSRRITFKPLPPLPPGSPGDATNPLANTEQVILETLGDGGLRSIQFELNSWNSSRSRRISGASGLVLLKSVRIQGFRYVEIGNAIFNGRIGVAPDIAIPEAMIYRSAVHSNGPSMIAKRPLSTTPEDRAIVVHEATHAICDLERVGVIDALFSEAIAFVAECLFFRLAHGRRRTDPDGRAGPEAVLRSADAIAVKILGGQRSIPENDPDFVALETPLTTTHASSANKFNHFIGIPA